jgi:hypothetical protein
MSEGRHGRKSEQEIVDQRLTSDNLEFSVEGLPPLYWKQDLGVLTRRGLEKYQNPVLFLLPLSPEGKH